VVRWRDAGVQRSRTFESRADAERFAIGSTAPRGPEAAHAFTRLFEQRARLDQARERAARERDRLDELMAHAVSTEPASRVWYASPGVLSIEQVAGAAGITALGVDRAMERYRTAEAASARNGARRRKAKRGGRR
jgi:hypothetical protein